MTSQGIITGNRQTFFSSLFISLIKSISPQTAELQETKKISAICVPVCRVECRNNFLNSEKLCFCGLNLISDALFNHSFQSLLSVKLIMQTQSILMLNQEQLRWLWGAMYSSGNAHNCINVCVYILYNQGSLGLLYEWCTLPVCVQLEVQSLSRQVICQENNSY